MKTPALTKAQKEATVRKWAEWILKQRLIAAKAAPQKMRNSAA